MPPRRSRRRTPPRSSAPADPFDPRRSRSPSFLREYTPPDPLSRPTWLLDHLHERALARNERRQAAAAGEEEEEEEEDMDMEIEEDAATLVSPAAAAAEEEEEVEGLGEGAASIMSTPAAGGAAEEKRWEEEEEEQQQQQQQQQQQDEEQEEEEEEEEEEAAAPATATTLADAEDGEEILVDESNVQDEDLGHSGEAQMAAHEGYSSSQSTGSTILPDEISDSPTRPRQPSISHSEQLGALPNPILIDDSSSPPPASPEDPARSTASTSSNHRHDGPFRIISIHVGLGPEVARVMGIWPGCGHTGWKFLLDFDQEDLESLYRFVGELGEAIPQHLAHPELE